MNDNCVTFFIYLQREQWLGEILWLYELLLKMMDEQVELSSVFQNTNGWGSVSPDNI